MAFYIQQMLLYQVFLNKLRGEHFDYMIHDSMFGCGRIIAQILKLPAINSCTSFAQDEKIISTNVRGHCLKVSQ